jgi:hypothetical protein
MDAVNAVPGEVKLLFGLITMKIASGTGLVQAWYRLGQALDSQHRDWAGLLSLSGDVEISRLERGKHPVRSSSCLPI